MNFTFDTGMLIALERRKQSATEAFRAVVRRRYLPVFPPWPWSSGDLTRLERHFPTVRVLQV